MLKQRIGILGRLAVVLSQEEIDALIDQHYTALNENMKKIAEVFSKGDIVGFSDALETMLLPWLKEIQVFSAKLNKNLEALSAS